MSKDRLVKSVKKFADVQYKLFTARYGQQLIDIFEFPVKFVLSPFTIAIDVVGSAQRGFGVPELISKLSYASIFVSSCKAPTFYHMGILLCVQSLRIYLGFSLVSGNALMGFVSLGIEEWILVYNSEKVTVFWVASVIWLFWPIGFCHWILGLWELILNWSIYTHIYVYWPVEIYL